LIHQELGDVMTKSATVVRRNDQLQDALGKVHDLYERAKRCSLSDTGQWTNQNVVFTKALLDMFPLALTILHGALARDESRGAHFKPEYSFKSLSKDASPEERRHEAEQWVDGWEENNRKWLKTTVASWNGEAPELSYEEVDTSLIPPRPRLYGLVGAEEIEKVYKERASRSGTPKSATLVGS
jgi:succinate dehydrogenase / fumarate reductase flavoprotein subunit